jgi:hypothetical protein
MTSELTACFWNGGQAEQYNGDCTDVIVVHFED